MPASSKPLFPDRPEYGVMTAADSPTPPPTWDVVREWLAASKYYWVLTSRKDGRPHARAVWGVWAEPLFHFTTSPETVMARNIARTGYAVVHPESAVTVSIIEGPVGRTEAFALGAASAAYESKYGTRMDPNDSGMPFYSLRAEIVLSWHAQDPRGSAVRWTFEH